MMTVTKNNIFDSHEFVKELVNRGMDVKQAEFLADSQIQMLDTQIATRADIYTLKEEVSKKIESSQNRTIAILGVAMAFIALLIAFK